MKRHLLRQALAGLALVAATSTTACPARADSATFSAVKAKYTSAMSDFESRLNTLSQFELSGGLVIWSNSAVKLGKSYTTAANDMDSQIRLGAQAGNGSTPCTIDKALHDGPYGSRFGLAALNETNLSVLNVLLKARTRLEKDEETLANRLAQLVAGGHTDLNLYDRLRALQNARGAIEPIYQALLTRHNTLNAQVSKLATAIAGPECGTQTTSQSPPKPGGASKSGCVGFNGYWANSNYSQPLRIDGNGATFNGTIYTGTVHGNVMSGTFAQANGTKGTFTFTMAYSAPDSIDVENKIGNVSLGLLTFHCTRGL